MDQRAADDRGFRKLRAIRIPLVWVLVDEGTSASWRRRFFVAQATDIDQLLLGWHMIYHLVMTNIAMERSTIFKFGKPSISMGHLYHGYGI